MITTGKPFHCPLDIKEVTKQQIYMIFMIKTDILQFKCNDITRKTLCFLLV